MNRAQRRRLKTGDDRLAKRIRELQDRVERTGQPGRISGLTDACRDCHADGEMHLYPGRVILGHIYHDDSCPAANGITRWAPCPL